MCSPARSYINHQVRCKLEREWPSFVSRYLTALARQAQRRWENSASHRELTINRTLAVIEAPWETELSPVEDTREFIFFRDFFNAFRECTSSCKALDLIGELSAASIDSVDVNKQSAAITFWAESYLNEVYIFRLRLHNLIKFIQRRYKKDADFTEFVIEVGDSLAKFVNEQLGPLINDRGTHVHVRRHRYADPELARLAGLDVLIDALGQEELRDNRKGAKEEAKEWLTQQVTHFSDLAWHLLNEVCRGFADGILLENDYIIVPIHYKDAPCALVENRSQ